MKHFWNANYDQVCPIPRALFKPSEQNNSYISKHFLTFKQNLWGKLRSARARGRARGRWLRCCDSYWWDEISLRILDTLDR
jgi:hypothetical protein